MASIEEGIMCLQEAAMKAEAMLPEEIKKEHFVLAQSRQSVAPWNDLSARYPENRALDALSILEAFNAQVQGLQNRIAMEGHTPDLHLGRAKTTIEKEREL